MICLRELLVFASVISQMTAINPEEKTAQFWIQASERELENAKRVQKLNTNIAKNVIIFLGDGMGVATTTAGRILKGQVNSESGEESMLEFDKFPHAAVIKTYAVDRQVSDSAATATAFLTGVKANFFTVGVTAAVTRGNCASSLPKDRSVESVFVDSYKNGKSNGVVTTTRINHATPSAAYAHSAERMWYGDADLTPEAIQNGCKDIAQQFIDHSHMFKVMLGGGRKYFQPNTTTDPEYPEKYNARLDGQDLIAQWKNSRRESNSHYVWNKEQFDAVDPETTDKLLGMFEPKDMKYEAHRRLQKNADEPSIADMTEKAIKMLRTNKNGYFLLVEGGRIDHAHHDGNAYLALHDTVAFDEAVTRAVGLTSDTDTLIIVTADHSHTMSMGGYSNRGNPIFGLAPSNENPDLADDGKPYTTLAYGNGPGFTGNDDESCHDRENLTSVATDAPDYLQQTVVPLKSETHGGEDVIVYAKGPMAHLFHGTHEQSYIAHVMRYVSCVGENIEHCAEHGQTFAPVKADEQVESVTYFLGMSLSSEAAQIGLYVQFVLLICFVVFSCVVTALLCRHLTSRKLNGGYGEGRRLDNKL